MIKPLQGHIVLTSVKGDDVKKQNKTALKGRHM